MEPDTVSQDQYHLFAFLRICDEGISNGCVRVIAMHEWFCEGLLTGMKANQKRLIEFIDSLPITSYITVEQRWNYAKLVKSPGLIKDASKIGRRTLDIFDHFQGTHDGITELLNMIMMNAFLSARQKTLQHVHNHNSCPECYRLYETWKLEYLGGAKDLSVENLNNDE